MMNADLTVSESVSQFQHTQDYNANQFHAENLGQRSQPAGDLMLINNFENDHEPQDQEMAGQAGNQDGF